MMVIDNKYNIGDKVYLVTDREQLVRMVTGLSIRPLGVTYALANGTTESWHYEFEISSEKNILIEA